MAKGKESKTGSTAQKKTSNEQGDKRKTSQMEANETDRSNTVKERGDSKHSSRSGTEEEKGSD